MPAFRRIYDAFKGPIMAYVRGTIGRDAVAEELTQDVFLKAYAARDGFRGDSKLSTWLWSIARNAALDHLRKRGELPLIPDLESGATAQDALADEGPSAETALVDAADQRGLQDCIDRLAPAQREALMLRSVAELPLAEIASQTGASESAVKSLLFRAREALAKCLRAKEAP
ncbi:MAG: sigma-70 family RNA polymerase sigma factor [Bdellovibrionales bacterium]|nr:sigma-70 family RNA polymerase sigma factor [Bdellovibrionales bacterium]